MKRILFIIASLVSYTTFAQVATYNTIKVRERIALGPDQRIVERLYNDTTFAAADSLSVPTSWAVLSLLQNRYYDKRQTDSAIAANSGAKQTPTANHMLFNEGTTTVDLDADWRQAMGGIILIGGDTAVLKLPPPFAFPLGTITRIMPNGQHMGGKGISYLGTYKPRGTNDRFPGGGLFSIVLQTQPLDEIWDLMATASYWSVTRYKIGNVPISGGGGVTLVQVDSAVNKVRGETADSIAFVKDLIKEQTIPKDSLLVGVNQDDEFVTKTPVRLPTVSYYDSTAYADNFPGKFSLYVEDKRGTLELGGPHGVVRLAPTPIHTNVVSFLSLPESPLGGTLTTSVNGNKANSLGEVSIIDDYGSSSRTKVYSSLKVNDLFSSIDLSTYLKKSDTAGKWEPLITKNSAFNKNFGITAGTVVDGQRFIDSIGVVSQKASAAMDAAKMKDTMHVVKPLKVVVNSDGSQSIVIDLESLEDSLYANGWTKVAQLPNLQHRDFPNDSIAVVDGGLSVGDWYRTGGSIKYLVATPPPPTPSDFGLRIRVGGGYTDTVSFQMYNYSGTPTYSVDWGDGTTTDNIAGGAFATHRYPASGDYTITFVPSNVSQMNEFKNMPTGDSLKILSIYNWGKFTNTETWRFEKISLAGAMDTLNVPSNVHKLTLISTDLTSLNFVSGTNITNLAVNSSKVTSIDGVTFSAAMTNLSITSQIGMTAQNVNDILIALDNATFGSQAKTLNLRQYSGKTPSGAGLTAKTNLEGKGWTITTD